MLKIGSKPGRHRVCLTALIWSSEKNAFTNWNRKVKILKCFSGIFASVSDCSRGSLQTRKKYFNLKLILPISVNLHGKSCVKAYGGLNKLMIFPLKDRLVEWWIIEYSSMHELCWNQNELNLETKPSIQSSTVTSPECVSGREGWPAEVHRQEQAVRRRVGLWRRRGWEGCLL